MKRKIFNDLCKCKCKKKKKEKQDKKERVQTLINTAFSESGAPSLMTEIEKNTSLLPGFSNMTDQSIKEKKSSGKRI